jgi:hypothetical protein
LSTPAGNSLLGKPRRLPVILAGMDTQNNGIRHEEKHDMKATKMTNVDFRTSLEALKADLETEKQKALVRAAMASKHKVDFLFDESVAQYCQEMAHDIPVLVAIMTKLEGVTERQRLETYQAVVKVLLGEMVTVGAQKAKTDSEDES